MSCGTAIMSSPKNSTSGRAVAATPALRAAPGPPCSLTMTRASRPAGTCWSLPSTTTIVSNPDTLCAASASRVRRSTGHRSRVGMTTARSPGVTAPDTALATGLDAFGPQLRWSEVLEDARRRATDEAVRRHRFGHDRASGDDGVVADVGDDRGLAVHGDARADGDRIEHVALVEKVEVRVAEAVVAVGDLHRLAECRALADRDRRRALDVHVGGERGAVADLDLAVAADLAR